MIPSAGQESLRKLRNARPDERREAHVVGLARDERICREGGSMVECREAEEMAEVVGHA